MVVRLVNHLPPDLRLAEGGEAVQNSLSYSLLCVAFPSSASPRGRLYLSLFGMVQSGVSLLGQKLITVSHKLVAGVCYTFHNIKTANRRHFSSCIFSLLPSSTHRSQKVAGFASKRQVQTRRKERKPSSLL